MVIAILGAIVTLLILLNRLADAGIDLGGLNPFLWQRRRKWRKKLQGNPVYQIDSPMDAVALLMLAVVKADGEITREDKNHLLELFRERFKLSSKEAANLLISSSHLLGNGEEVQQNVAKVLEKSLDNFSDSQIHSSKELIREAAGDLQSRPEAAAQMIADAEKVFASRNKGQDW